MYLSELHKDFPVEIKGSNTITSCVITHTHTNIVVTYLLTALSFRYSNR